METANTLESKNKIEIPELIPEFRSHPAAIAARELFQACVDFTGKFTFDPNPFVRFLYSTYNPVDGDSEIYNLCRQVDSDQLENVFLVMRCLNEAPYGRVLSGIFGNEAKGLMNRLVDAFDLDFPY